MSLFKSILLSAAFTCGAVMSAQAQTADSPAAQKSYEDAYGSFSTPWHKAHIHKGKFADNTSVSFGIQEWPDSITGRTRTQLSELMLNQLPIDSETLDAINAFLRDEVWQIEVIDDPIVCSGRGQSYASKKLSKRPCDEIRLQFKAVFKNKQKFVHPKSGAYNSAGFCSIFIQVRERDASIWCHGRDENPPEPIVTGP